MNNFKKYNIQTNGRTSGKLKTFCPKCRDSRKNKRDKSLSVNLDTGLFNCHYCSFKGCAREKPFNQTRVLPVLPPPGSREGCPYGSPVTEPHKQWLMEIRHITPEVIARMQITSSVEYIPQKRQKEPCICFNYLEKGELINVKFRTLQKEFSLITGAELIPYNIDAVEETPECIITEGEIDALSFLVAGRNDVISAPNGANSNLEWMDRFVKTHMENKKVIYIAADNDYKGNEMRRELFRRLGVERCRKVTFREGCKDANEQLIKHGPESLLKVLEEAPQTPLEGVFTALDIEQEVRNIFENGLSAGADTGLANFDRYCTFELGRLCVLTGVPGCGKSEFLDELVLRLALRHDWKAAYFSPENMPSSYHTRKLAEKLTGRPFKESVVSELMYEATLQWLGRNIFTISPRESFHANIILNRARELVTRKQINMLVIDPYNRLEHPVSQTVTETQYISSFLDKITNFALRYNCLVFLVAHPTKLRREPGQTRDRVPTLYDINGSAAFFNKCDFGLVVERDRTDGVTRIHVEKVKFRHLGSLGMASYIYNTSNGRYSPCEENPEAATPQGRIVRVDFDNNPWIPGMEGTQLTMNIFDKKTDNEK